MKRLHYTLLLLLTIALMVQSCIKRGEDVDCPNGVQIYFKVSASAGSRAASADAIKQIDLLVFNADTKLYVAHESATDVTLDENFYMTLPIGTGKYRFIAWANVNDMFAHSSILSQSDLEGKTYDQLFVDMQHGADGVVDPHPKMLYFGDIKSQPVIAVGAQHFVIEMLKDTYTITLKTKGLPNLADTYELKITDQNGRLNYENNIASTTQDAIVYKAPYEPNNDPTTTASINVLKLVRGRNIPRLIFTNTSQNLELTNKDLMTVIEQMLAQVPGATLDNTHRFDIELEFDGNILTDINVNGWRVKIEQDEEIIPQ